MRVFTNGCELLKKRTLTDKQLHRRTVASQKVPGCELLKKRTLTDKQLHHQRFRESIQSVVNCLKRGH